MCGFTLYAFVLSIGVKNLKNRYAHSMVNYQSTLDAMPKGILVSRIYAQYNCKSGRISSIPERGIRKIALKIAYDGRVYHGVQKDPNGLSIGEVLENALRSTDLYMIK
ncbi:tRNA pseudouridine synthase A [Enterocytozoon bieneusi H348]|nr:tRNA pseudouridine synthase A [Enterocytozoon bieneusi H348]|eukprot:XP_002652438.1 tRNA pseudouridine synthase A [Enterocytozoon bieneusi H348]